MPKWRWRGVIRNAPNWRVGPASRPGPQSLKQSRLAPVAAAAVAADDAMNPPLRFLDHPPPFLFFTGKGGVGKTSLACAHAILLADQGKRVLLVSTDPASNVGQVFGIQIGNQVTPIETVPGLS